MAIVAAFIILIGQLFLQLKLAKTDSQTTDEGDHLAAGYTYVTTDNWWFNPEHPPLTKTLAGLAILHLHPKVTPYMNSLLANSSNYFYDSWQEDRFYGEQLLYNSGNNPKELMFWGRVPFVLITFLLGLTILLICWSEWGALAALAGVSIYALDPTVNGHGFLINTDLPLAFGYLLTIYWTWKYFSQPIRSRAVFLGLSLGFALLVKHTAVIALPAILMVFVFHWILTGKWKEYLPKLLLAFFITWVTIWAGFGFHDRVAPPSKAMSSEYTYISSNHGSTKNMPVLKPTKTDLDYSKYLWLLDLFPGDYVKGLYFVTNHAAQGHPGAFLLGETSQNGWWYYFPAIIFYKTPIPSLILILIALFLQFKKKSKELSTIGFSLGAVVFLVCAMTSKANLGIRHIMPIYPLLFLTVGYVVASFPKWRYLFAGLFIWLLINAVTTYPYFLSFFNGFAQGSYNGYQVASDSNLDWGQDLGRIADYIKQNKLQNIYIDYNWDGNPALDYYLGAGNYKQLTDWKPGNSGNAVLGAFAYETNIRFKRFQNCPGLKQITPSVFVCPLK